MVKNVNAIQTNDTRNLLRKTDYDKKSTKLKKKMPNLDKYITTPKYNKLTTKYFTPRLKQAQLATKNDIDDFVKKTTNYF